MDEMDKDAKFNNMPPCSVSFYFQNGQRSARVTSEALAALLPSLPVETEAENIAAYQKHWKSLHAIALRIDPDPAGVVHIRRYHLPRER